MQCKIRKYGERETPVSQHCRHNAKELGWKQKREEHQLHEWENEMLHRRHIQTQVADRLLATSRQCVCAGVVVRKMQCVCGQMCVCKSPPVQVGMSFSSHANGRGEGIGSERQVEREVLYEEEEASQCQKSPPLILPPDTQHACLPEEKGKGVWQCGEKHPKVHSTHMSHSAWEW